MRSEAESSALTGYDVVPRARLPALPGSQAEGWIGLRRWIDGWNNNPRSFVLTKAADEILKSLAEYLGKFALPPAKPGREARAEIVAAAFSPQR